jgi:hypothetical protein
MAVFSAVASIVGANKQSKSAQAAGDASAQGAMYAADIGLEATKEAIRAEREMFDISRDDLAPHRQFEKDLLAYRQNAVHRFATELGKNFETSPGYQFRLSEGLKAVDNSAAARGMTKSGAALKATQRFGEGLASSEYDTHINRLAALAGMEQSGATQSSAQGALATGQSIGNTTQAGGFQRASMYQAAGDSRANALLASGQAQAQGYAGVGSAIGRSMNALALYRGLGGKGGIGGMLGF